MFDEVVAHLVSALPNEGVGLIATVAAGVYPRAVEFFAGTNVDRSPTRYTMDAAEVLAAVRAMRANGWELGAIVHSHVASPPRPSATDLREAYHPSAMMLIVGLSGGAVSTGLWSISSTGPVASLLVLEGDDA